MPLIKSAIKKLQQDDRRRKVNVLALKKMRTAVKLFKKGPSADSLNTAFSEVDKAVKKNLIHKNKAARFKSQFTKTLTKVK